MAGANVLDDASIETLRIVVREVIGAQRPQGAYGGGAHEIGGRWYFAKTASTVLAGSYESPTTFTWNIWFPDTSSMSDPVPLIVSTDSDDLTITGVNYWKFACDTGTQFRMIFAYGVWLPSWADC